MKLSEFNRRFFETSRGRIVALVRKTSRTVNDLAESLDLTDNAVRSHLMSLERDGLVRPDGKERGVRKPNVTYGLTEEGEQLFPKAYGALLAELLEVMKDRLPAAELDAMLREVGRRLASANPPANDDRLQHAVAVLNALGGLAELETESGRVTIRGHSCPLKEAVAAHPSACAAAESMLSDLIGAPVTEQCIKGPNPRCCFELHSA